MVVLEIAGQEDTLTPEPHGQHDGGAIDGAPVRQRATGEGLPRRPEDLDPGLAEDETGAANEATAWRAVPVGGGSQLDHARSLARHPRLRDVVQRVARHEAGETAGVVLVGVRQHGHVDVAVPHRDVFIEALHEQVGVRAAVDEHAAAVERL